MSPSRAPIGRVEWTRWVAAMACRCGRSTHGDNDAPRSDVQGSTPPPRRRRGACESSQVFQLAACARPTAAASRARPDPDIRLWSGMVRSPAGIRPPVRPGPARSATPRPADLPRSAGPAVLGGSFETRQGPSAAVRTGHLSIYPRGHVGGAGAVDASATPDAQSRESIGRNADTRT